MEFSFSAGWISLSQLYGNLKTFAKFLLNGNDFIVSFSYKRVFLLQILNVLLHQNS